MPASFYNKTAGETFRTILHTSDPLLSGFQVVFDGEGTASSVSIGKVGDGLSVTGSISSDSAVIVGGDLTVGGNLKFPTQTTLNDVTVNYVDNDYSLEAKKEIAVGSIRLENASTNYQVIFGKRTDGVKWKVDVDGDDNLNFRRNDESVPPLYINKLNGKTYIKDMNLEFAPTVTTVETPTEAGKLLVYGNIAGAANTLLSTVSSSGFQRLPSGMILQWGTAAVTNNTNGTTISFLTAFPNNAINVTATPTDDFSSGANYMGGNYAKIINNSTFKCMIKSTTGSALQGIVNWQAIGY